MKTLTKVLCMLMVIVMCMSFFGAAAYADDPAETETPAETEAPAETETPAETEAPAATAEPEEVINPDDYAVTYDDSTYSGGDVALLSIETPVSSVTLSFELSATEYELGSGSVISMYVFGNAGEINSQTDYFYAVGAGGIIQKLSYTVSGNCVSFASSSFEKLDAGDYNIKYASGALLGLHGTGKTIKVVEGSSHSSVWGSNLKVEPRYGNTWSSGDGVLWFVVDPSPVGCKIYVDGKPIGNMDYDETMGGGYFYLGTKFLDSLSVGWHGLQVEKDGDVASCQFKVLAGDVTLKPKNSSKHVTGSGLSLTFVCSDPINTVFVGSKELTNYDSYNYYYLSSDGKTITLTAPFLNNKLTAGSTYYLSVETDRGPATCAFQVLTTAQASSSPQTGDSSNIALWTAMLIMTGVAAIVVIPSVSKRKVSE